MYPNLYSQGPDQVPLIEDLEQIFMRSWRESHLSEIRQYQQPQTPATQGRHYALEVRQCVCDILLSSTELEKERRKKLTNCSSAPALSPDPLHPARAPAEPATPDPQPASLARPAGCVVLWRGRGRVRGADQIFGSRPRTNVQQVDGRTA